MKTLIAILGIVLVGMTTVCPLGCARHNKTETFTKYGFSFEYPAGYEVDERGVYRKGDANSDSSGSVVLSKEGRSSCLLVWDVNQETEAQRGESDLRAELGSYTSDFEEAFGESGGSMQVGDIVEDSCSGHKMLRCYYVVVWSGGTAVSGDVGQVYCGESRRSFMLFTESSHKEDEEDALAFFRMFTSSLVCH